MLRAFSVSQARAARPTASVLIASRRDERHGIIDLVASFSALPEPMRARPGTPRFRLIAGKRGLLVLS
jgi:hypothetical protein